MFDLYFLYNKNLKKPNITKWQHIVRSSPERIQAIKIRKANPDAPLGITLRATELVIDIDPRNDGTKSLIKLEKTLGISLHSCVSVLTGQGGLHYYYKIDVENIPQLHKKLPGYDGIEFLSIGMNVIAPDSCFSPDAYEPDAVNNVGRLGEYTFAPGSQRLKFAPPAPVCLLNLIAKNTGNKNMITSQHNLAGAIGVPQLIKALNQLDVTEYRDYQKWLHLLFAIKSASTGNAEVQEAFIDWSTEDSHYADASASIEKIYKAAKISGGITYKTFCKEMRKTGGNPNALINDDILFDATPKVIAPKPTTPLTSKLADLNDYVYVSEFNQYLHLISNKFLSVSAVEAKFGCYSKDKKIHTRILSREFGQDKVIDFVHYKPYIDRFSRDNKTNLTYINLWLPPIPLSTTKSSSGRKIWQNHWAIVFPDEVKQRLFHTFMSVLIQNKGHKIKYALHISSQFSGVGKTTVIESLLRRLFGASNVCSISQRFFSSRFNDYIFDKVLVMFNEARINNSNRSDYDTLKSYITDEYQLSERKGQEPIQRQLTANFILTSNAMDSVLVAQDDRRFVTLHSNERAANVQHFTELFKMLADDSCLADIVDFYQHYAIDKRISTERAYATPDTQEAIKASYSSLTEEIEDILHDIPHSDEFILASILYQKHFKSSSHSHFYSEYKFKDTYHKSFSYLGYLSASKLVKIQGVVYRYRTKRPDYKIDDIIRAKMREQKNHLELDNFSVCKNY